MSWDERKSRKRVSDNDFRDMEIEVADLARTMDFENLGTKDALYPDLSSASRDIFPPDCLCSQGGFGVCLFSERGDRHPPW